MEILPIATPSCVLPNTIKANAEFLAGKVSEVGLAFFETNACLEYTEEDLPKSLADLPLLWHAHLPVDLTWHDGADVCAETCLEIIDKVKHLDLRLAVLHPPTHRKSARLDARAQSTLLYEFYKTWSAHSPIPLLLENINIAPLTNLDPELFKGPFGVCLDIGHMLGFYQKDLLQSDILKTVKLVHWSAPGRLDEHLPLTQFNEQEYLSAEELVKAIPRDTCHMLEIFNWDGIVQSYPILKKLLDNAHA